METLSRNGAQFRSKLMTAAQAAAFAKCLQANPRFDGVSINLSERAKSEKNRFVSFVRTEDPDGLKILARQQSARDERAAEQGADYEFVLDTTGNFFWCLNVTNGEVYETTEADCSCPDHSYRCRAAGITCKHIKMLCEGHSPVRGWSDPTPAPVQSIEERTQAARALWD